VNHLRRSFPQQVSSETLKKLGIAPLNETYVINTLRFINALDPDGKKTPQAGSVFSKHDDPDFQKGLAEMIEKAYADLFSLHGNNAWTLPTNQLISFFRGADHTSLVVGRRQAHTFQALSSLSGHGEPATLPGGATPSPRAERRRSPRGETKPDRDVEKAANNLKQQSRDVGLTVRIEINLPAAADQETYDKIFKSIRANLLNGE
jgi:hypothetical protein